MKAGGGERHCAELPLSPPSANQHHVGRAQQLCENTKEKKLLARGGGDIRGGVPVSMTTAAYDASPTAGGNAV